MKLYDYWRSTAAYRVRIALNLKGIDYQPVPVDLLAGEESGAAYRRLSPQGLVPTLLDGDRVLTQSLAICEYLEETRPAPALLPASPEARCRVRSLAQVVTCDIHPLNNSRVLKYLVEDLGAAESDKLAWYRHWVSQGLSALEVMLASAEQTGRFCHGDEPGLADLCLIPQLYNARRFDCELNDYPTLTGIESACQTLPAFVAAEPQHQSDAR